ncbi:MAG TPA: hypothetical protein VGF41_02700, partial [Myxococcaceae bacterium]
AAPDRVGVVPRRRSAELPRRPRDAAASTRSPDPRLHRLLLRDQRLAYEPLAQEALRNGRLRQVLAEYAAEVPGLFLYYPGRSVSPAFRAFIDACREVLGPRRRPGPARVGPSAPARAAPPD